MRNTTILSLVAVVALLFGCNEFDKVPPPSSDHLNQQVSQKTFDSQDSAFAYADEYLTYYAQALAVLAEDTAFRSIVHNEVAKEFDGDYNVIIDSLQMACDNQGYPFRDLMDTVLDANNVGVDMRDLEGAFQNIDDSTYYPQIYIPEFPSFENTQPGTIVTAPANGDESKSNLDSYISDADVGYGYSSNGSVGEDHVGSQEIWVVSINGSVDSDGNLLVPKKTSGHGAGGGGSSCSCTNPSPIDARIKDMTVKWHKEEWYNGKSDVAIRSMYSYQDYLDPTDGEFIEYAGRGFYSKRGVLIRQFSRDEVDDQVEINVNALYIKDWNVKCYYEDPVASRYIIFERDAWPADLETEDVTCPNNPNDPELQNLHAVWRSAQDAYAIGWAYGNDCQSQTDNYYVDGLLIDNQSIKFDLSK